MAFSDRGDTMNQDLLSVPPSGPGGHGVATASGTGAATRQRVEGEGTRSIRVQHAAASVPAIRHVIVEDLRDRGLHTTVIEEAETVVCELVANAVRHAKALPDGCVRVRWKVKAGAVEVEVSDGGGPSSPRPLPRAPWASGGRGLRIVRSMAHEWGVQEERHGRTVWAALGGPSRRRRL